MIPYRPRPVWADFHASRARWRVAVAHRRAGKTVAFVNEAIRAALSCGNPEPRLGYLAPQLGQAKERTGDVATNNAALAVLTATVGAIDTRLTEVAHDVKNLLTGRIRPVGRLGGSPD